MKWFYLTITLAVLILLAWKYEGTVEALFKAWVYGCVVTFFGLVAWCYSRIQRWKNRRAREMRDWVKEMQVNDSKRVIQEILTEYHSDEVRQERICFR